MILFVLHGENTVFIYSMIYWIHKQYKKGESKMKNLVSELMDALIFVASIVVVIACSQFPLNVM